MNKHKIIVVGGGPAGMMAAIRAAELNQEVCLIEKNPSLGKKLLLSGKGRCNLTNTADLDLFLKRFAKNGQFLRDAFKLFFNSDLIDFFQKRGLPLRIERQKRVFPGTDRAGSILDVLVKELEKDKVNILYDAPVKDIIIKNGKALGVMLSGDRPMYSDCVILATGGISYGFTGSTGEGLNIAKKSGHRIVKMRPGLIALETEEKFPARLEGIALKNIRLKVTSGSRRITSDIGELLFTDFGISGPLVLALSGRIVDWLGEKKKVSVVIDLKIALTEDKINVRLVREFNNNSSKKITNILRGFLPERMVEVFLDIAGIPAGKKANQITAKERLRLVRLFKGLKLNISKHRPMKDAMITQGGVALSDIDPRSMRSRKISGVYFAGEMIDVDADCGGFNLQAAFSTGFLAGESASR